MKVFHFYLIHGPFDPEKTNIKSADKYEIKWIIKTVDKLNLLTADVSNVYLWRKLVENLVNLKKTRENCDDTNLVAEKKFNFCNYILINRQDIKGPIWIKNICSEAFLRFFRLSHIQPEKLPNAYSPHEIIFKILRPKRINWINNLVNNSCYYRI